MDIKTMSADERKYTYRQSQQISMQTNFIVIGYLRADFGTTGKEFYSSWNDFRKDLKTDEFKAEFDNVINALRENDGILSGRGAMSKHCYDTPESSFENDREEYGVRVDTEKYAYLMRLNPRQGEYNLYCYCYEKQWLDRHISQAEKGIRFIDPHKSCSVFLMEIKSALFWTTANRLTGSADISTSTIWRWEITSIISASLPSEWSEAETLTNRKKRRCLVNVCPRFRPPAK